MVYSRNTSNASASFLKIDKLLRAPLLIANCMNRYIGKYKQVLTSYVSLAPKVQHMVREKDCCRESLHELFKDLDVGLFLEL